MHGTEEPPHFCPHHKTIVDKKEHYNDLFDPHLKGYFHFSTTPLLNEAGEIEMVVEVARDITSIKLAEEDLRIKENALASSLSGFAMASMDAKLSYVNDSFLKIWGYNNLNEILGRSALEFWEKAEEAQNMISALSANGEWSGEMKGLKKDGTKIDVQLQANLVKNEQGEPICLFSSFMDITKRKKVEADLLIYARELEASNNLKDLFSDIISHDLLNPAGVIKNFMEFLLEDETQEEKIEILERTHHSSLKLIKIIEEAQIYSRLKTMDKFETNAMDLLFLIKDAIEEYRQILKKQEIQVILPLPGNYMAWVNPLLGNVFSNIISNSIKYAGDGKKIEVEIQDEGESFKISFKDYGLGIPPAYRKKLFERFFRLEEENIKGLGLGLAITRYLVALHKGQIWIEDNPAGGSIFFVRIPKEAGFGEGIGINPSRL
jgi:PAS domain S-box-containing protein